MSAFLLHAKESFEWMAECQQAFEDLKAYFSSPPLLSPLKPGEELFLYLAVSLVTVSAALSREENKVQKAVYYASWALRGAEERYPLMEKLAFALIIATRKLKPYFQTHTIVILTDKPLRRVMSSLKAARRMALWAIKLSEFDIQYRLCTAIKGHVVADFVTEFINLEDQGAKEYPQWSIHTDRSSNRQAGRVDVVLHSSERDEIECMIRLNFPTTNNKVEYEAIVAGPNPANAVGASSVVIHCDSQVVTNQVNGDYNCKGERMKKYLEQVKRRVDDL